MSNWTHVAGIVRIDDFRCLPVSTLQTLYKKLGPIMRFMDGQEEENILLPCGSEGSLEYAIWENPRKSDLAAYTVSVWGDLRDYEEVNSIINWVKATFDSSLFMIRQGVFEMYTESEKQFHALQFDGAYWLQIR